MQHADDTADDLELIRGDFEPGVEGLDHPPADLLALVRGDICERFQYRLYAR